MTSEQAELEVLKMTAQTRAAHTSVVTSTILSLASMLFAIGAIVAVALGKASVLGFLWWIVALGLSGLIVGGFAWRRLNKALNQTEHPQLARGSFEPAAFQPPRDAERLPPAQAKPASVTEGTTELLEHTPSRRTQITGPIDG